MPAAPGVPRLERKPPGAPMPHLVAISPVENRSCLDPDQGGRENVP
jgi:hypothetical protein